MVNSDFQKRLWLSSVQLVRVDEHNLPTNVASGCLIDYFGKRILLTVSHATKENERWGIQLRYDPEKKCAIIYGLGAMHFLEKFEIETNSIPYVMDFSYVEVPSGLLCYRQEIEVVLNIVKSETACMVHTPSLIDLPNPDEEFGFCGQIKSHPYNGFSSTILDGDLMVYSGLSFLRTEKDYHVFSLPFPHPGREYFRGCSGAPILSNTGTLVALLCSGDEDKNEIWGISIRTCKTPIDILVGNVG